MVAQQTRALERELRAEAQRERLERKQQAAIEARSRTTTEKQRQREAARESKEFLCDVRAARRELERMPAPRSERPATAPPKQRQQQATASTDCLADEVRARAEASRTQRAEAISEKLEIKEAAQVRKREEVENERAMKRLYAPLSIPPCQPVSCAQVCASLASRTALPLRTWCLPAADTRSRCDFVTKSASRVSSLPISSAR
jgi:hypothetical protein